MIEALLLNIGGAATNAIFRLWLQNSTVAQEAGTRLDTLIQRYAPGGRVQRAMKREMERTAELIASRLEPFFEVEFRGLTENEKVAAAGRVQTTVERAKISDELLLATDLEPQALEEELRRSDPDAAADALLSEAATAFYDVLLQEVSNYIVEIRLTLPDFGSVLMRAMFQRETELLKKVEMVLDRLPQEPGLDGRGTSFEVQYRRDVARKLNDLELFGITTKQLRNSYSLSVAYLTLTVSGSFAQDAGSEAGAEETTDFSSIPVDEALADRSRLLVRGEAGSGKTTLLQWLAVSSARGSFRGALADWNDSVPFLLKLRRFVDGELPAITSFAAAINPHTPPPEDWVIDHLQAGTALVLIDGIDELPEERRESAHEWLVDLVEAYPEARYVVTSRPPAVDEDWLAEQKFAPVALEPMEVPAISAFIDHWHRAIATNAVNGEEEEELDALAESLKRDVREKGTIRNLASSPLLCAMLCALNRDREGEIPSDRIELYRIALEMLDRRDIERKVRVEIAQLGQREKEILLRVFALWLLNNGRSDALRPDLVALVEDRLASMPRVEASAEQVTEHLLVRSGLLRQPAEGRVDFIHRTFQEYLAGKEAVATRSDGLLLENAHLDQWQEVVVLAAGLAELDLRERLINGLIERGNREQAFRHRLHLLAVGCLDTSAELSPELIEKVDGLLKELMPPRNLTEAKAIASAGELAVPLLGQHAKRSTAGVAAACVRALTQIGGESALAQLERFGPDRRVTVARELLRGWDEYSAKEYAQRVLAKSPLDYGHVVATDPSQLEGVAYMEGARSVSCDGSVSAPPGPDWNWSSIAGHQAIKEIELTDIDGLTQVPREMTTLPSLSTLRLAFLDDLRSLGNKLPDLRHLSIVYCERLEQIQAIAHLEGLESLNLSSCGELGALPPLPGRLEQVALDSVGIGDLTGLERCEQLNSLAIEDCGGLWSLRGVPKGMALEELLVEGCPMLTDVASIAGALGLRSLTLRQLENARDLSSLRYCEGLVDATLADLPALSDVGWLTEMTELRYLTISNCQAITELPPLECPSLSELFLSRTGILDLGFLSSLDGITTLELSYCRDIDDLTPLRDLDSLVHLGITGCRQIEDVSVLLDLPNLRSVRATGLEESVDFQPLRDKGVRVQQGFIGFARPRRPRRFLVPRRSG